MKLYTYYRSSAAYRVRIALNLKGLDYESIPVHLVRNGGEQRSEAYTAKNPQGLVPMLETEQSKNLTQSTAIIEYLEEVHPEPALLPKTPQDKALVRALVQAIACDVHPLNNLRVLQYLTRELEVSEKQKKEWYRHWVNVGFSGVEKMLHNAGATEDFCFGDTPGFADCVLIPQVYNAERFDVDMSQYPLITRINQNCLTLDAFSSAAPDKQVDAE